MVNDFFGQRLITTFYFNVYPIPVYCWEYNKTPKRKMCFPLISMFDLLCLITPYFPFYLGLWSTVQMCIVSASSGVWSFLPGFSGGNDTVADCRPADLISGQYVLCFQPSTYYLCSASSLLLLVLLPNNSAQYLLRPAHNQGSPAVPNSAIIW